MNLAKRAFVSIIRQKGKSFILLTTFFLLLTITSASIFVRQAIINADNNLRRQLPAIATIRLDSEEIVNEQIRQGGWVEFENVLVDTIRYIGELPYVQMYDYTAWGYYFFSDNLVRANCPDLSFNELFDPIDSIIISEDGFVQFTLKGTNLPQVIDIESGLVELVMGRTFSVSEIEEGSLVAIVNYDFLKANQLTIGSTFSLYYHIYNPDMVIVGEPYTYAARQLSYPFLFEVIGVFEYRLQQNYSYDDAVRHVRMRNQIYVPNRVIESTIDLYIDVFSETHPELLTKIYDADVLEEVLEYENILFLLKDPTYLVDFSLIVMQILPEFWVVEDLSNAYGNISVAMATMNSIANSLALGSILATILTISLLILLFLRDRKAEMGIYLALGCKKAGIVAQMVMEVLVIALVAVTIALIVGQMFANNISTSMIRNDMKNQVCDIDSSFRDSRSLEAMGFRHEMTHEEMLASYDVSFDLVAVISIYIITLFIIFLAVTIPIIYLSRLSPKKILL